MASYRLSLKKSVEKDIRKIDRTQIPAILAAIESLVEDPFPPQSRKLVGSDHTYRLRVGDYRVIYFVFADRHEIEVQLVAHRKNAYR